MKSKLTNWVIAYIGVEMSETKIVVDWQACKGRGLCHELLPEVIDLDDWGYPIIKDTVPRNAEVLAKAAIRSCPTLALRLES